METVQRNEWPIEERRSEIEDKRFLEVDKKRCENGIDSQLYFKSTASTAS